MLRFTTWVAALLLCACHSPLPAWTPVTQPTCTQGTGSPDTDQQRAFLAALLALDAKRYVILENRFPERLVAHYVGSYQPQIHVTRWQIDAGEGGDLRVATVPPYDRHHDRLDDWYRRLTIEVQRYQCRELEWLSWYAESKGLLPIGSAVAAPAEPLSTAAKEAAPSDGSQPQGEASQRVGDAD